jgi:hypothetical protein
MKWMKLAVVIASATAFGRAYAFHDGGVAYCDGCHSMHNSSGNKTMSGGRNTTLAGWNAAGKASTTQFKGNAYLLQGSDDSSTCLNCHAANDAAPNGYHVMTYPAPAAGTAPVQRTPGGDFGWLSITNTYFTNYGVLSTTASTIKGERHGHNIVAQDYGLLPDTTLLTAPGGNYPAANLSCASCHDPHSRARIDSTGAIVASAFGSKVAPIGASGSYGAAPTANEAVGVYRLLATANYAQMSLQDQGVSTIPFAANPPVAVAPSTYNRSEGATETRVAYGAGMSEWCANCHVSIHADNSTSTMIHPASNAAKLQASTANDLAGNPNGTTIEAIYNAYKSSGDLTGTSATSYTSLVPYEEGVTDVAKLATHAVNDGTQTGGPTGATENVMCLSCHRAHASGWSSMTRWNNKAEFITVGGAYPGTDATGEGAYGQYNLGYTQAQYAAAMYDRPATNFAFAQRSLCNKCHAKD